MAAPRAVDRSYLRGQVIGRLTVLDRDKKRYWTCLCSCGQQKAIREDHLYLGQTLSCGCIRSEKSRERVRSHGETNSAEHKTWAGMRKRCLTKTDRNFHNYGGRGITICERWNSYENFLADMGRKPSSAHSIDRIDNDGNYEPSNCRWATATEQVNNQRRTVRYQYRGESKTLTEWSAESGISYGCLQFRIYAGETIEQALSRPSRRAAK